MIITEFFKITAAKALSLKINSNWDEIWQETIEILKSELVKLACFTIPRVNKDFIFHTIVSSYAISAVQNLIIIR